MTAKTIKSSAKKDLIIKNFWSVVKNVKNEKPKAVITKAVFTTFFIAILIPKYHYDYNNLCFVYSFILIILLFLFNIFYILPAELISLNSKTFIFSKVSNSCEVIIKFEFFL